MNARNTPTRKAQRGGISLEAAMLLPLLMLLVLGCIDFGRLLWAQTVVSSAAAEAARMAVLSGPSDSVVADVATSRVLGGGIPTPPSVSIGARQKGQPVSVTVSVGFDFLTLSQLDPAMAARRTVSATSVMIHQP